MNTPLLPFRGSHTWILLLKYFLFCGISVIYPNICVGGDRYVKPYYNVIQVGVKIILFVSVLYFVISIRFSASCLVRLKKYNWREVSKFWEVPFTEGSSIFWLKKSRNFITGAEDVHMKHIKVDTYKHVGKNITRELIKLQNIRFQKFWILFPSFLTTFVACAIHSHVLCQLPTKYTILTCNL